jgi:hypothetical protein
MISEEIVDTTWRRVASLDPGAARGLAEKTARRQPALLAYVLASTADERREVQELTIYLYYVVQEMFDCSMLKRVPEVRIARVEYHAERNEAMLSRLEGAHPDFVQRAAEVQAARQPFVMRYVVEALVEGLDDDPSMELTDEESGLVFLTLKTVVDALDEAVSSQ